MFLKGKDKSSEHLQKDVSALSEPPGTSVLTLI